MGTVPFNFPPDAAMQIGGQILTGVSLGNTGPLANTVFFTAPNRGLYQLGALIQITQTDGSGTLTLTTNRPPLAPANISGPVTSDLPSTPAMVLLEKGAQISCSVSAAGIVATTFNVYLSAVRSF